MDISMVSCSLLNRLQTPAISLHQWHLDHFANLNRDIEIGNSFPTLPAHLTTLLSSSDNSLFNLILDESKVRSTLYNDCI